MLLAGKCSNTKIMTITFFPGEMLALGTADEDSIGESIHHRMQFPEGVLCSVQAGRKCLLCGKRQFLQYVLYAFCPPYFSKSPRKRCMSRDLHPKPEGNSVCSGGFYNRNELLILPWHFATKVIHQIAANGRSSTVVGRERPFQHISCTTHQGTKMHEVVGKSKLQGTRNEAKKIKEIRNEFLF